MKTRTWLLLMLAAAPGCKKPHDGDKLGSSSNAGTAANGTGSAPASPIPTAEGGAIADLPVVSDCPKSLGGAEAVARTIKKECGPVIVTKEYDVNGSLTLEAGAVLKFQDGADLEVGYNGAAKLIIKGTAQDPVLLTSAGDAAPGAWPGVRLYEHAARSQLAGVIIENAGGDKGALFVDAADVTLTGSTIRNAKDIGLKVDHRGTFAKMADNTFDRAGKLAVSIYPEAVGGLGSNKLDAGAVVQIEPGHVTDSAKWQNPGAPYQLIGEIDVDGKNGRATLEITAGTELHGKDAELDIGYSSEATLVVSGTADKPVVFTAAEDKTPGAWHGIWIYGKGEAKIANATIAYAGGGAEDRGALMMEGGVASITGVTFDQNKRGVNIKGEPALKAFDHNKLSASAGPALEIVADQIGGLGTGNTFDKDAHIQVTRGKIQHTAVWQPQGVPYEVTQELTIDDKVVLTLSPGVELAFATDQQLSVGYSSDGTLKASGTADKPITLRPLRDDVTWKGVWFYEHAAASELAHVQISSTSGDAAIQVEHNASVKLSDITGTRCAGAVVTSKCGATLTTSAIKAVGGTAELKPSCK
ncbi:MAG TPA: hypothetical protein VGC42_26645 [Kofleriaceae bacterium]